jgi:putative spermidine/putrescine transport system substrate-binding protein
MNHPIRHNRRGILRAGGMALIAAPYLWSNRARAQDRTLFVNTWGGSWTAAEESAYFKPFTETTGIKIRTVAPVSFAKLKAQVLSKTYEWDVSSAGIVEFAQALAEGLVEPIDKSIVDPGKFPPGNITDFGAAGVTLGTCLVYRTDKFPDGGPQSWADFWDVKRFPGARCLFNRSFTSLAFALLADGVPADKLYPMDIDRAFRKLDQIKPHIKVWWTQGTQSQQLIGDGEVDMIAMWNARAQEMIDRGAPLKIVWNGAENYGGYWYAPKGTPRAKLAFQFLELVSQPKPQADFVNLLPYGPSNPKAFEFISKETALKMPTNPDNLRVSHVPDANWLAPRLPEIRERFTQWLAT